MILTGCVNTTTSIVYRSKYLRYQLGVLKYYYCAISHREIFSIPVFEACCKFPLYLDSLREVAKRNYSNSRVR